MEDERESEKQIQSWFIASRMDSEIDGRWKQIKTMD